METEAGIHLFSFPVEWNNGTRGKCLQFSEGDGYANITDCDICEEEETGTVIVLIPIASNL